MPTYEYACTECGQHLEVVQSMSDAPPTTCSNCGGRLRKVFTPIGVVFKGSGFYRTDSRGKPAKTDADKADKPGKPDKGGKGKTPEAKPASESASASPKKATEKSA